MDEKERSYDESSEEDYIRHRKRRLIIAYFTKKKRKHRYWISKHIQHWKTSGEFNTLYNEVFGSVELFKGVSHKQHTAMMVMAMLGFYFEVARHDRDDHVVVHVRHIRPDKLHHFEKIRSDATLPLPYDYKSATHPSWQFWRKIGKKGISSVATYKDKDPDGSIMKSFGQNPQLLSDLDIVKINSVYGVQCFKKKLRDIV